MSARIFYLRIAALVVAACLVALLVRLVLGDQSYRLYGFPAALLLILPLLSRTMARRMTDCGMRPRRRFWLIVPLGLAAVLKIGFWVLFFSTPQLASIMHIIGTQIGTRPGTWLPYALIGLLALWFLVRLGRSGSDVRS